MKLAAKLQVDPYVYVAAVELRVLTIPLGTLKAPLLRLSWEFLLSN